MGFAVYYRSSRPVAPAELDAIHAAARSANEGRTWLGCEPVFFANTEDGHLFGGSKPNFTPDPDDAAAAAHSGLPDGTTRDVIDILCRLSRDHGVDWEISHDDSGGPIGYIRDGICDDVLLPQIDSIDDLADILREMGPPPEADNISEEIKTFEGSASVARGDRRAAVAVCLRTGAPSGEARSQADIPRRQPELACEAAAISALGYASADFRRSHGPCHLIVTHLAGDADPDGFAVAACYATWSAINVDPPEGFDNQGWEQTT